MPRFKPYSYEQTKLIPVDFESQLQPGTFEFALHHLVNEMDLTSFSGRFRNDETGAPAYDPSVLLKIVLFAYSRGITSSREIERACTENVVFMALSADSHPHFTTIADFISSMTEEIEPLFRNVLLICAQEGLIGRQMFAIDGCKISSNCSKEWSGTRADFEKKKAKIEASIRLLLRKHRQIDERDEIPEGMREKEKDAIRHLRSKAKRIEKWLETGKDKLGASGNIKQSNLIDNESAKMPTSHGVVQGYNGVAAVDSQHQVIVHAEAFGEGAEKKLLRPMLDGVRKSFTDIGEPSILGTAVLVADNGYHSEENLQLLEAQEIEAYIPDNQFRKRDPAFAEAPRYRRSVDRHKTKTGKRYFQPADFIEDRTARKAVCPAGKDLYLKNRNFVTPDGYPGVTYIGKKTDCRTCSLRSQCLRHSHTEVRQVTFFSGCGRDGKKTFSRRMMERFDTAEGRFYYSRRMGIVEPVFGNVCSTLGLDWFSLRGRAKVNIQWKLFAIVHNLLKVARYGPRFALA